MGFDGASGLSVLQAVGVGVAECLALEIGAACLACAAISVLNALTTLAVDTERIGAAAIGGAPASHALEALRVTERL
jgi:hypothetical protein